MAFFDNLKEKAAGLADKAKELADTGVSKAKELSEISKLKLQNANERDAIRKAYLEIGKLYYATHRSENLPYNILLFISYLSDHFQHFFRDPCHYTCSDGSTNSL